MTRILSLRFVWTCTALILLLLASCRQHTTKVEDIKPYTGPIIEVDNIETLFSDSAEIRLRMRAPKQLEFADGNREFPKGIYLEFFDENQKLSSLLTSEYAYYKKETNLYTVRGNVVMKNFKEGEILKTEELHWEPQKEQIYTDKAVRIETPEEILTGKGMVANEDFSYYKFTQPTGTFTVDQP